MKLNSIFHQGTRVSHQTNPKSDLDCVVIHSSLKTPACLYALRDQLSYSRIATSLNVLPNAKVPILKYVDAVTRFHIDVSFNTLNGMEAAQVVKRYLQDKKIGTCTKTLMFLLKQFLVQRYYYSLYILILDF